MLLRLDGVEKTFSEKAHAKVMKQLQAQELTAEELMGKFGLTPDQLAQFAPVSPCIAKDTDDDGGHWNESPVLNHHHLT